MNDAAIDVYVIDLDAPAEEAARLAGLLSAREVARAQRLLQPRHQRRFQICHGRLREILGQHLDVAAASIAFASEANGKPVIDATKPDDDVHFNLSHSSAVAVVAVTRAAPLGVDVEFMKRLPDRDAVVARFFSLAERDAFRGVPEHQQQLAFYNGWTRKEAVIKATGEGLHASLDRFDVTLVPGEAPRVEEIDGDPDLGAEWRLFDFEPVDNYRCAVAIRPPAHIADELAMIVHV